MIEFKHLSKNYQKKKVLKDISLSIQAGKRTAVLGPNGSGKTTLIKTLLGLVIPTNGEILYKGSTVSKKWSYRENISYLPQITNFPDNLMVKELLKMINDLRGGTAAYQQLIERFGVDNFLNERIRNLSGGMVQKVNLILTFGFDSDLYILDEPSNGLDPTALIKLKELIFDLSGKGKSFLFTTHILPLVEQLADEIIFLLEGEIIFQGSISTLKENHQTNFEQAIVQLLQQSDKFRGGNPAQQQKIS
ncbi:MAG: ABC transporter ATP-binding protein [Cytophagales bacterium]|nr:ABC transporter ATP-binding protein [Cytophagales bacterium]